MPIDRVDVHWSQFFGVPLSALRAPGVVVTPICNFTTTAASGSSSAADRESSRLRTRGCGPLEHKLGGVAADELLLRGAAARAVGDAAGEILGPSFQGWLPADCFRALDPIGVRRLSKSESGLVDAFRSQCSLDDWKHGGIDPDADADVWASFDGPQIAALGQMRPHWDVAVDPCVVTRAEHRSRGHAQRLVSAMAQEALLAQRLVLYQALTSNAAAVSLALHLGFELYATLIAVRLVAQERP